MINHLKIITKLMYDLLSIKFQRDKYVLDVYELKNDIKATNMNKYGFNGFR